MSSYNFDAQIQGTEDKFCSQESQQYYELSNRISCINLDSPNAQHKGATSLCEKEYIHLVYYVQQTESTKYGDHKYNPFSLDCNQNDIIEPLHQENILSQGSESIQSESNFQSYDQKEQTQNSTFECLECQLHICHQHELEFSFNSIYLNNDDDVENQKSQYINSENTQTQIEDDNCLQNPNTKPKKLSAAKVKAIKRNKFAYSDKYTCILCNRSYANHGSLTNHRKRDHPTFKTSDLQKKPNTTKGRPPQNKNNQQSLNINNQNKSKQTKISPNSYPNKVSVVKIKAIKKNKFAYSDKYTCILCSRSYANHGSLTNHRKRDHPSFQTSYLQKNPNTTKGRPLKNKINSPVQQN
ncbi:hypothetical protein ABPG72_009687 [Tetrahymena utriculariae]